MLDKFLELVGLPSPATALAVLIALAAAAGFGFHLGDRMGADRVEARYSTQKDIAAEALRQQLATATAHAVAAENLARKIADQGAAFQTSLTPLLRSIRNEKPIPVVCVSDELRLHVNTAVRTINQYGDSPANHSDGVLDRLPKIAPVGG